MASPSSLQRECRRALFSIMKQDLVLTTLVADTSINPEGEPAWPFILIESPRTLRLRMSCVRGARVSFDVHAFAGPRTDSEEIVETGYDHVSRIADRIERLFAESTITLESGAKCGTLFSDAQMFKDGEPDRWHWFSQLNCRVLAE